MNLVQWAEEHHSNGEKLTHRQQYILNQCLEGILNMNKKKVEEIYKKDKKTNFSGDEEVTASYPKILISPCGIGTDISINGKYCSEDNW